MPKERSVDEELENLNSDQHAEVTEEVIRERAYLLWSRRGVRRAPLTTSGTKRKHRYSVSNN